MKKEPIDLEKEFKTLKQGKKKKKMSDKRRKALAHARGIIKRLEKAGYDVNFGDVAQKSTRKLQNVSRKSLIQSGIARWKGKDDGGMEPPKEWELELRKIIQILEEGENYYGEHSTRESKDGRKVSAKEEVNLSAKLIKEIIDDAVERLGGAEVVRRIKKYWRDLIKFEELINKLIQAVYDDVYATWGTGGRSAYDRDIAKIREILDVDSKVGEFIRSDKGDGKNGDYDF